MDLTKHAEVEVAGVKFSIPQVALAIFLASYTAQEDVMVLPPEYIEVWAKSKQAVNTMTKEVNDDD